MGKLSNPGRLNDITTKSMGEIGALQLDANDRPGGFMVNGSMVLSYQGWCYWGVWDGKINEDPWGRVSRSGALFFWCRVRAGLASQRSMAGLFGLFGPYLELLTVPVFEVLISDGAGALAAMARLGGRLRPQPGRGRRDGLAKRAEGAQR